MITFGEMKLQSGRLAGNISNFGLVLAGQAVNDIQKTISQYLDWSFLRAFAEPISLTAGTFEYTIPSTIQRVDIVYYTDAGGRRYQLKAISDKDYVRDINESDSGDPWCYLLHGSKLIIGPPPSSGFVGNHASIYVEKVTKIVDLVDATDEFVWPDEFEMAIKYGAAGLLCLGQGDMNQSAIFTGVYQSELGKLKTADMMRYGNLLRIVPGPCAAAQPPDYYDGNSDYRPA